MLSYCLTSEMNLQLQKLCKHRCATAVNAYQPTCPLPVSAYCVITFGSDKQVVDKTCSCYVTTIVFSNAHRPQTAVIAVKNSTN